MDQVGGKCIAMMPWHVLWDGELQASAKSYDAAFELALDLVSMSMSYEDGVGFVQGATVAIRAPDGSINEVGLSVESPSCRPAVLV